MQLCYMGVYTHVCVRVNLTPVESFYIHGTYIRRPTYCFVTCRRITMNSSASAPLNAKKIAVKKVSDVAVVMFGLEL